MESATTERLWNASDMSYSLAAAAAGRLELKLKLLIYYCKKKKEFTLQ